ncbi:hypothetical protein IFM89_036657 [Coptis chinensis]|uniref:Uncharacterized protein n=1 Tax=Coptis chinensis TaxID=261450 RepID=A0A835M2P4_9MAGN|nr:hypothetical protein IFM89_036657 [Coptis chinensis]
MFFLLLSSSTSPLLQLYLGLYSLVSTASFVHVSFKYQLLITRQNNTATTMFSSPISKIYHKCRISLSHSFQKSRNFRSKLALEALTISSEENLILYNYPSFSGAFSALSAHLYHTHLNIPHLILPFSFVEPFKIHDFNLNALKTCYLLDFIGPKRFAIELAQLVNQVLVFDHRKSSLSKIPSYGDCPENVTFNVDVEKSSSTAVYDYFSSKLRTDGEGLSLVNCEDKDRLEMVLKYIEDGDLRKWSLPDIKAFNVGLNEMRPQLNYITNAYMFDQCSVEQLLEVNHMDLITRGNTYIHSCQDAVNKLLDRAFKLRLGKGFYGECLGIRADGNSHLSNDLGRELSLRSAEAGLRPIGAVIYMQRRNLKMCLRSTDDNTDTSEVAKVFVVNVLLLTYQRS